MKVQGYLILVILFTGCSCSTLDKAEVKSIDKTAFDSFKLSPGEEVNNLRIDLIRQRRDERVNDSVNERNDTPYHPIGFDLGNGLFYDLNENLCLRVDYLLNFSPDNDFEIQRIDKPWKNKGIVTYSFRDDTLTYSMLPRKRTHYVYHKTVENETSTFMHRRMLNYRIIETDTSFTYSGKKTKWNVITKIDDNQYYLNKIKRGDKFYVSGNDVYLDNNYLVSMTNNNKTIEVKGPGKRNRRVLYTIEKSKDKIIVYDKNYKGLKIEKGDNVISIYLSKDLVKQYKLIQESQL